ncbi:hypothetical protein J4226_05445 [Candidatus Pacearchaeota archaeon]|nr:hypothetical protein [Candidatus Pacearchaeota archaeon]
MKYEIDVSGYDLFQEGYTICVASDCGIVKGFKFKDNLIAEIQNKWSKGFYRYRPTKGQRGLLKVRIYCIIIHYLIKELNENKELDLIVCRDFPSHENNIKQNFYHFIEILQGKKIKSLKFEQLPNNSNAHGYAYLMSKDKYNHLGCYVNIKIEDIEPFLKKKIKNVKGTNTES